MHNGFSDKPSAIICAYEARSNFDIIQAQWGYIPGKKTEADAKLFKMQATTLNFKGENLWVSEKGGYSMWSEPALKRRCLVLSTGIVESRHIPKSVKRVCFGGYQGQCTDEANS